MIRECYRICDSQNLIRPICEQPQYNMLCREKVEVEFASLFEKEKMGCTVFSPLKGGILTGKYRNDVPVGSRLGGEHGHFYKEFLEDKETKAQLDKKLHALEQMANRFGVSQGHLALSWVIKNKVYL